MLILCFRVGGGFPEAKRAFELSQLLGVNVSPSQVYSNSLVVSSKSIM